MYVDIRFILVVLSFFRSGVLSQNVEGQWSQWSQCDLDCGGGITTRYCVYNPLNPPKGATCPQDGIEADSCNKVSCDTGEPLKDIGLTKWSAWAADPSKPGELLRKRNCVNENLGCEGYLDESIVISDVISSATVTKKVGKKKVVTSKNVTVGGEEGAIEKISKASTEWVMVSEEGLYQIDEFVGKGKHVQEVIDDWEIWGAWKKSPSGWLERDRKCKNPDGPCRGPGLQRKRKKPKKYLRLGSYDVEMEEGIEVKEDWQQWGEWQKQADGTYNRKRECKNSKGPCRGQVIQKGKRNKPEIKTVKETDYIDEYTDEFGFNTSRGLKGKRGKKYENALNPTAPTSEPITKAATTKQITTPAPTTQPTTTVAPTTEPITTLVPTTEPITTLAPTTEPITTLAPTTEPITTLAPTTEPITTAAPTTEPITSVAPTTEPITTLAPTTEPFTTVAPTTQHTTTVAPTTQPTTTVAPTTEPITTLAPTTEPITTLAPTTEPITTVAPTTQPATTVAPTTQPTTTEAPTTQPTTTVAPTTELITTITSAPEPITTETTIPTTITEKPTTEKPTTEKPAPQPPRVEIIQPIIIPVICGGNNSPCEKKPKPCQKTRRPEALVIPGNFVVPLDHDDDSESDDCSRDRHHRPSIYNKWVDSLRPPPLPRRTNFELPHGTTLIPIELLETLMDCHCLRTQWDRYETTAGDSFWDNYGISRPSFIPSGIRPMRNIFHENKGYYHRRRPIPYEDESEFLAFAR